MDFVVEQRASDSPYIEMVMRGRTVRDGSTIRPAENHWHMVITRYKGQEKFLVVGPWTTANALSYAEGAEILWIKFKLGTFMPHRPVRDFVNTEMALPEAGSQSFWLKGSSWQFPDFENADTFVDRLVQDEALAWDPVVNVVLQRRWHELPSRTVRHRFLRATGVSQNQIQQVERARRAESLLRQGVSILDTVEEAGYSDQPHLTRSLKQWIGYTPVQLMRLSAP